MRWCRCHPTFCSPSGDTDSDPDTTHLYPLHWTYWKNHRWQQNQLMWFWFSVPSMLCSTLFLVPLVLLWPLVFVSMLVLNWHPCLDPCLPHFTFLVHNLLCLQHLHLGSNPRGSICHNGLKSQQIWQKLAEALKVTRHAAMMSALHEAKSKQCWHPYSSINPKLLKYSELIVNTAFFPGKSASQAPKCKFHRGKLQLYMKMNHLGSDILPGPTDLLT